MLDVAGETRRLNTRHWVPGAHSVELALSARVLSAFMVGIGDGKIGKKGLGWRLMVICWLLGMPRPSWLMKNHMSVTVHRQLRALSYPDESEMGLFFALAIPLDDSISTKAISVAFFFEANYQLPKNTENLEKNKKSSKKRSINQNQHLLNRKTIYSMLESKLTAKKNSPRRGLYDRNVGELAYTCDSEGGGGDGKVKRQGEGER
ncbi:hypothetical protein PV325_000758 [Microctonus aethiopoides]|nr:hypothetical protein PV325_000758 [Microctonus aethiopoides]